MWIFVFRHLDCFNSFAVSVQSAVEEFHGMGFAHLDLRVPDICFDGQWQAVLIDLDRSGCINNEIIVQNDMYNVHK